MTATYFIRLDGTDYDIQSFELNKELSRSISDCEITIVKTDADNINIGDEPSLMYYDGSTTTTLFSGIVTDKSENESSMIRIESFGAIINHTTAEEIYLNRSPEYIMEDLITNYTDLTYASTATSGLTISRFVSDNTIGDAVKDILDVLKDWIIFSDNDKNFYFEPNTTTNSSETVTINVDSILTSDWNRNPDQIVNQVTLIGDVQTFSTDIDGFTASGGETSTTLSYKPKGNILITKNGTELVGGVDENTANPDFTVDRDNAVIYYTVALTVSDVITIFYEYEVPIKVTAQNDVSIDQFGLRGGPKIENKSIRTMDDARLWIQNYLATNSLEDIKGEFDVDINRNINTGELLPVVDEFNNIDQTFLVQAVTTKYPEGIKSIKVGRIAFDQFTNDKDIKDRLKKLEQKGDNSDLLQLYREVVEQINVVIPQTYRARTRTIDNSWIAGSSTNAIVGTWTGTSGGGQLVVGGTNNVFETTSITNANNIFYEPYDATTYIDTDNTDATINTTTAQAEFTSGQIVTSTSIFKNNKTVITTTPTIEIDSGIIKIEASNNKGVTWNDATNNVQLVFPFYDFEVVGGNILKEDGFKILQENGNGILSDVLPTEKELLYRLTENNSSTAVVTSAKFKYTV